jgi:hypothetical protein
MRGRVFAGMEHSSGVVVKVRPSLSDLAIETFLSVPAKVTYDALA